jgi:hypothetical protein
LGDFSTHFDKIPKSNKKEHTKISAEHVVNFFEKVKTSKVLMADFNQWDPTP